MWQVQNSNLWPLGYEPSELPTAPTCDVCSLSSQTSCIFNWINLNTMNNTLEARAQRRTSCDDKIGIILLSPCISYTTSLWVVIWMMKINHLFGFSELFHVHQTATFWAVLAPTILHSGVVRLLTWCRLAGFSYVVRPFARSRHPLMLSSYFFSTHTISVHQYVKEQFFHVRSLKLSSDARLSLPERPTL